MIRLVILYVGIIIGGTLIGTGLARLEHWFKNRHKKRTSEGAWNKWF